MGGGSQLLFAGFFAPHLSGSGRGRLVCLCSGIGFICLSCSFLHGRFSCGSFCSLRLSLRLSVLLCSRVFSRSCSNICYRNVSCGGFFLDLSFSFCSTFGFYRETLGLVSGLFR